MSNNHKKLNIHYCSEKYRRKVRRALYEKLDKRSPRTVKNDHHEARSRNRIFHETAEERKLRKYDLHTDIFEDDDYRDFYDEKEFIIDAD